MKYLLKTILILTIGLSSMVASSEPKPNIIIYKGTPVHIVLNVNEEQRITFPDTSVVWFDIKPVTKENVTFQIAGKDIHLTATKGFKKARVVIGDESDPSNVYLLDIEASYKRGSSTRIVIKKGDDPFSVAKKDKVKPPETEIEAFTKNKSRSAGIITLNRYAAHQLYAPKRLRMKNSSIYKRNITRKYVGNLIRGGDKYFIKTEAAWKSGKLYITALSVTNKLNQPVTPDVRNIRGAWRSMMFRHNRLSEANTPFDSTTLFLVSAKPFKEAILSDPIIRH